MDDIFPTVKEDKDLSSKLHETGNCTSQKKECGQNVLAQLQDLRISLRKYEIDFSRSLHKHLCSPVLRNVALNSRLPHIFENKPHLCTNVKAKTSKRPCLEDSILTHVSPRKEHFSELASYIDRDSVTDWLERARISMTDLRRWCHMEDHFVRFAHFWLTDIPYNQMLNLLQMEVGIIDDELYFAFFKGFYSGRVRLSDLQLIRSAILSEYPNKLISRKGQYVFLDYLNLMSSEPTMEYRSMLSNVKNTRSNPCIRQLLLAMRAFVLSSAWHAVVKFYETLVGSHTLQRLHFKSFAFTFKKTKTEVIKERALQSVQLGYVDVLHYLIRHHLLNPCILDDNKRNLIFLAVIYNQPNILDYINDKVFLKPDVNQKAENGNTPLHAAVTTGNKHLVSLLLHFSGINVDATNSECGGATALHLAVIYGHLEICNLLVRAGADTEGALEGATPGQLAQELGYEDIADLMNSYAKTFQYYK